MKYSISERNISLIFLGLIWSQIKPLTTYFYCRKIKTFTENVTLSFKLLAIFFNVTENRSQGYKTFFMLNATEHEISPANKSLNAVKVKTFLAFKLSDVVFIMLINVKMPTIVGILTFMSSVFHVQLS